MRVKLKGKVIKREHQGDEGQEGIKWTILVTEGKQTARSRRKQNQAREKSGELGMTLKA